MSIKHFGEQVKDEIYRRTVVAVLYDPSDDTYIYEYWPQYYNLATLVSGGVEDGEDIQEAVSREIIEETGYTDFSIKGKLGDDIYSHYYQASKKAHYVKHITAFLVILNSDSQIEQNLESDEKFKVRKGTFDDLIASFNNYNPPNKNSVEDQIEILRRGRDEIQRLSEKR